MRESIETKKRRIQRRTEMLKMEASLLGIKSGETRELKMRDAAMASAMKARIYRLRDRESMDLTVNLTENTLIITRI